MTEPTPELLEKLMHVSTATLTTALFKRGFRNVFIQGPYRMNPGPNMVGPAYTLRYIPAREDLDGLESFADRANPQRKGVEECPPGSGSTVRSHFRLHRSAPDAGSQELASRYCEPRRAAANDAED